MTVPFDLDEVYLGYLSESWKELAGGRRLSSRQLDAYYAIKRIVPRRVALTARRLLSHWQRGTQFPSWPYDDSVAALLRLYALCVLEATAVDELEFRWFWPDQREAAVTLTHDVESAEGLRLAIEVADLEEARRLRSSFNVVADWYPVDQGIIRELRERGFELGVHGVHHDRSMFSSRENFKAQVPIAARWGEELGADGFRSPSTHRVFDWLAELPFQYDCTIPHSDPYEPVPGGCCSPWPFFMSEVVELPYTLPQDHTLFTVLGHDSISLWLQQLERLVRVHGLVQCVTHPDPEYLGDLRNRKLYSEFLDRLVARHDLWFALPRTVAQWWRTRDRGGAGTEGRGLARREGFSVEFAAAGPLGGDAS